MTNLSYLSKIQYIAWTFFVIFCIGYIVKFSLNGFNIVDTMLFCTYAGLGIVFYRQLKGLTLCMHKALSVLKEAVKGNLESRAVFITDSGEAGMICKLVNDLIDQMETFMREMATSVEYAGKSEFFRKFNKQGLNPAFSYAGDNVNKSIDVMKTNYASQLRTELNADLSSVNKNNEQLQFLQKSFATNTNKLEGISRDVKEATQMSIDRSNDAQGVGE